MVFHEVLAALRHESGISQKKAAADLDVSQALLSHYENGVREPRLEFVVRACDYYGVSADAMLGRVSEENGDARILEEIETLRSKLNIVKNAAVRKAAEGCFCDAVARILFLLEQPGNVLQPEHFIREQQGYAALKEAMTQKSEAQRKEERND